MGTRERYINGMIEAYDDVTQEIIDSSAANYFYDDFANGAAGIPTSATTGYPWIKKIVGAAPPTVAPIANAVSGQIQLALTATSEKQDAVLYFGDALTFDVTKATVFEARAALTVAPSAASVQMVMGLAWTWIDGPDNNTRYLEFGATANANLLVRSQDTVTQKSLSAAQIGGSAIALDTAFHVFRIRSLSKEGDVSFEYDGNRVNTVGSITYTGTGVNAVLQPYIAVYKPSGTGLATLVVDKVLCFGNRV